MAHRRREFDLGRRARGSRGGFTLIELMLGLLILTVGAGGALASVITSMRVGQINRETALAQHGARGTMEALLITNFDQNGACLSTTPHANSKYQHHQKDKNPQGDLQE